MADESHSENSRFLKNISQDINDFQKFRKEIGCSEERINDTHAVSMEILMVGNASFRAILSDS